MKYLLKERAPLPFGLEELMFLRDLFMITKYIITVKEKHISINEKKSSKISSCVQEKHKYKLEEVEFKTNKKEQEKVIFKKKLLLNYSY